MATFAHPDERPGAEDFVRVYPAEGIQRVVLAGTLGAGVVKLSGMGLTLPFSFRESNQILVETVLYLY